MTRALCEECVIDDAMDLPPPPRSIHKPNGLLTNFRMEDVVLMHEAMRDDIDSVSALPPNDPRVSMNVPPNDPRVSMNAPPHGTLKMDTEGRWTRYCVPCAACRDIVTHPQHCTCGAPWERP